MEKFKQKEMKSQTTLGLSKGDFEFEPSKIAKEMLVSLTSKRSREIIRKRYGLDGKKKKTLEDLGEGYSITRERVRQIEEDALRALRGLKEGLYSSLAERLSALIEKEGGLVSQKRLLKLLFGSMDDKAKRKKEEAATVLILELSDKFEEVKNKIFNKSWTTKKSSGKLATETIRHLKKVLEKEMTPLTAQELLGVIKSPDSTGQAKRALWSYIDASSQIYPNPFGKWGLKNWTEISPKGARDRAYLVLKESGRPLHFREIAELINKTDFKFGRPAYAQTVHNELIKSDKFVLVGRGVYALSEWGYKPGTVRQVIESLLEKRPMGKEEILGEVLKKRQVKRNTVILNLNDGEYFVKTKDGKYTPVK